MQGTIKCDWTNASPAPVAIALDKVEASRKES